MAESVSTAIVQETVSQILSGIVQKYEEKEESNANRNLERLEMAHIRLEAALETSEKWKITDPSLLRWRARYYIIKSFGETSIHPFNYVWSQSVLQIMEQMLV